MQFTCTLYISIIYRFWDLLVIKGQGSIRNLFSNYFVSYLQTDLRNSSLLFDNVAKRELGLSQSKIKVAVND